MAQPMQRPDVSRQDTRPTHIRVTMTDERYLTPGRIYPVVAWLNEWPRIIDDEGDNFSLPLTWFEAVEVEAMPNPAATSGAVAGAILREAADVVEGDRNSTHGDKERSFTLIAEFWHAYLAGRKVQGPVSARDVAQMMVLLKVARSIQGTANRDHFFDQAGYSAIAGELAAAENV